MFSCTGMGRRDSNLDFGFGFCSFDSGVDSDLVTESASHGLISFEGFLTYPAAGSCCHLLASG